MTPSAVLHCLHLCALLTRLRVACTNSDDEDRLFPEGWAPKANSFDSDDEVPLFPKGWAPKLKRVDSEYAVPLFPEGWAPKEKRDPVDDVPLFP